MIFAAKECGDSIWRKKTNSPEGADLWAVLARYGELILLGCCCLLISAQPFAYVVADYTRSDRNKKSGD